eukprot:6214313-Pleurochrysis_carterae.AAC.2
MIATAFTTKLWLSKTKQLNVLVQSMRRTSTVSRPFSKVMEEKWVRCAPFAGSKHFEICKGPVCTAIDGKETT